MMSEILLLDWVEVGLSALIGALIAGAIFTGWSSPKIVCAAVLVIALGCVIAANVRRERRGRRREKNDTDRQAD